MLFGFIVLPMYNNIVNFKTILIQLWKKIIFFFFKKISLVCLMAWDFMYILDANVYNIFIIYSMYIILDFSSTAETYYLWS